MTLLSVVIVNYRSGELLNACLEALFRDVDLKRFRSFVVNNDCAADLSSVQACTNLGCRPSKMEQTSVSALQPISDSKSRRENSCSC